MSDSDSCSCSDCNENYCQNKSRLNKIKKYNSKSFNYMIDVLQDLLNKFDSLDKRISDLEKKVKKLTV